GVQYSPEYFVDRALNVIQVFVQTAPALLAFSLACAAYLIWKNVERQNLMLVVLASALTAGSLVAAPYTEPRAFMFVWCVMSAVSFCAVDHAFQKHGGARFLVLLLSVASIYT